eukprot:symbB.v1.2.028408.t1/scaffold3009.1/size65478/7
MATKRGFRRLGAIIAAHAMAPKRPEDVQQVDAKADKAEAHEAEKKDNNFDMEEVFRAMRPFEVQKIARGQVKSFDEYQKWEQIVEQLEQQEEAQEVEDRRQSLEKHPEYIWKNGVQMRVMLEAHPHVPCFGWLEIGTSLSIQHLLRFFEAMAELEEEETVAIEPEKEEEVTDLNGAVRGVLKRALQVDGVIRGLHEVAKHVEACKAQVVFLAESCNEATYKKLIQGLCLEKNVPVVDVPDNKSLGEWAGLCKIDKDGLPRKVVGTSCVAVIDFGEEGEA